MNNENLEKLGDNCIDIAESFMGGGGHASNTEVIIDYLKEEFDIDFDGTSEAEDLSLACQSGIEQAIYDWIKKKRSINKINNAVDKAVDSVYGNKEDK